MARLPGGAPAEALTPGGRIGETDAVARPCGFGDWCGPTRWGRIPDRRPERGGSSLGGDEESGWRGWGPNRLF